MYEIKRDLKKV